MKQTDMPSLMFKVAHQVFAVDTSCVSTIFQMQGPVTPMPDYPDYIKGVFRLRDEIIPVVEMRTILKMPSIQEEYEKIADMFEQRKKDHIHWVEELNRSVRDRVPFQLATDPHKCAFGRWYDSFQTDNQPIMFHIKKIEQPHALLHQSAAQALHCDQNCEKCTRSECLKNTLGKAETVYMPQVLELLEQAKEVFKSHYREMCIVLTNGDVLLGLLVDEVLSVEDLIDEGHCQQGGFAENKGRLVNGVVHSAQVDGEILVLNDKQLFDDFIKAREMSAGMD